MKDRIIGNEGMKLSLYKDDFILYGENPKKSTNNLNFINLFNMVSGFKVSVENQLSFCRPATKRQ